MEEFEKLESLIDNGATYAQVRFDEARLTIAEKSAGLIAFVVVRSVITLVFMTCLLFVSAAAAIVLGDRFGREWLGFLLMGGFYFLLGWLVVATRDRLLRLPVMNAVIRQIFKDSRPHEKN